MTHRLISVEDADNGDGTGMFVLTYADPVPKVSLVENMAYADEAEKQTAIEAINLLIAGDAPH